MRDLKDNNRELRAENGKLKEKLNKYEDEVGRQGLHLKNLQNDIKEERIRVMRKDELEA